MVIMSPSKRGREARSREADEKGRLLLNGNQGAAYTSDGPKTNAHHPQIYEVIESEDGHGPLEVAVEWKVRKRKRRGA